MRGTLDRPSVGIEAHRGLWWIRNHAWAEIRNQNWEALPCSPGKWCCRAAAGRGQGMGRLLGVAARWGKSGLRVLENIYRTWEGGPMDGPVGWWVGGIRKQRFGLGLPLVIGSPMRMVCKLATYTNYANYNQDHKILIQWLERKVG